MKIVKQDEKKFEDLGIDEKFELLKEIPEAESLLEDNFALIYSALKEKINNFLNKEKSNASLQRKIFFPDKKESEKTLIKYENESFRDFYEKPEEKKLMEIMEVMLTSENYKQCITNAYLSMVKTKIANLPDLKLVE